MNQPEFPSEEQLLESLPRRRYAPPVPVVPPNGRLRSPAHPVANNDISEAYQRAEAEKKAKAQQEKQLKEAKQQKTAERKRKLTKAGMALIAFAIVALCGAGAYWVVSSTPRPEGPAPTPTIEIREASGNGIGNDFGGGKQRVICRPTISEAEAIVRGSNAKSTYIVREERMVLTYDYCASVNEQWAPPATPTALPVSPTSSASLSNAD